MGDGSEWQSMGDVSKFQRVELASDGDVVNPFRTAVLFWGQFGTNYLEFDWCVPETGLEF